MTGRRGAEITDWIAADDLEDDPDGRTMAADRMRARRNAELAPDHLDTLIATIIENTDAP